jgi:hypothetical protein
MTMNGFFIATSKLHISTRKFLVRTRGLLVFTSPPTSERQSMDWRIRLHGLVFTTPWCGEQIHVAREKELAKRWARVGEVVKS